MQEAAQEVVKEKTPDVEDIQSGAEDLNNQRAAAEVVRGFLFYTQLRGAQLPLFLACL